MTDAINPTHYTRGAVECIDAIEAATVDKRGIEAACTANIIKYLWRYEAKNGIEDVKKARWYLERLIAHLDKAEFGHQNTIDCRSAEQKAGQVDSVFSTDCMVCGGRHYGLQCPHLRVTAGQVGA